MFASGSKPQRESRIGCTWFYNHSADTGNIDGHATHDSKKGVGNDVWN